MKCKMCDFRLTYSNRERISLMDISGSIMTGLEENDHKQLDFMTGELSLEKSLSPVSYNTVITVSGIEPGNSSVCTIAKFPTKICPKCGKPLK